MKRSILLPVFLFLTVQVFHAQTADDIIKKYFDNAGGIDKWKSMTSLKMSGNLVMPQGEFPFAMYRKSPNKFKVVMKIMDKEFIPQAFDGETGWMINPFTGTDGAQKLPEEQVTALRDESEFEDPFIDYKDKGFVVSYEGTAEAGGVTCHVIKLVKHQGEEGKEMKSTYYFDTENSLQIMIKQATPQTMGQDVEIYMSDYREVGDGYMMPFVLDTQLDGQSIQKLNLETITVNEDIADEVFKFPGEIAPATN